MDGDIATDAGPLLAPMPEAERALVLREARGRRVAKEAALFHQGDEADLFYLLVEGRLRVEKLAADGARRVMRFMGPGDFCGIAMALGRSDYPATAIAAVDSRFLQWPSSAWPRLMAECPSLAGVVFHSVGARLQETQEQLIALTTDEVERRVAAALLRLADKAGRPVAGGVEIDFPLTRQNVAELTGTTLHTASRILSAWQGRGLVDGGRKRIVLRDMAALSALAGDGG